MWESPEGCNLCGSPTPARSQMTHRPSFADDGTRPYCDSAVRQQEPITRSKMLYCHTIEGHGCTDRCRNIRTRSDKVAVFQFTLTCSHRPIFICFVSVASFSVALKLPRLRSIVQQVFSKNSPTFSSLQR